MSIQYEHPPCFTPRSDIQITRTQRPDILHLTDTASCGMIDLQKNHLIELNSRTTMDTALEELQHSHQHIALVIDDHQKLLGVISSADLLGSQVATVMRQHSLTRDKIMLKHLLHKTDSLAVLTQETVSTSRIGNIMQCLNAAPYALVVTDAGTLCGLFKKSDLNKRLAHSHY